VNQRRIISRLVEHKSRINERKSLQREEVRQAFEVREQQLGGEMPLFNQAPIGRRRRPPENPKLCGRRCIASLEVSLRDVFHVSKAGNRSTAMR
jgi:hypothetical protein